MNNTIFDDVFRTMVESMPELVIPLINEVFGTKYPLDTKYDQLNNEHPLPDGNIITDSCLRIGKNYYHIECQSSDDKTMAIRMIEYDFHIALGYAAKCGHEYTMEFPKSCVLYVRYENVPQFLKVNVIFPDESRHIYRIPTLKVSDYAEEDIIKKNLLLFLPYYILRYEKSLAKLVADPDRVMKLKEEYDKIKSDLQHFFKEDESGKLTNLMGLIEKIADYVLEKYPSVRKELDLMGGKVLQLESERLYDEGQNCLTQLLKAIRETGNKEDFDNAIDEPASRGELCEKYGIPRYSVH